MSVDFGLTPDLPTLVYRHVTKLFDEADADMIHLHFLPDGYNCNKHGIAVVVADDASQEDETAYTRDLVRVSVYGPDHTQVRNLGRRLYVAMTQGMTGIGLGVSRSRSTFFGSGPTQAPTGFVSTMSLSVGIGKTFASFS